MSLRINSLNLLLTLSLWLCGSYVQIAQAQTIVPAADGTGTTVIPQGNQFYIQGGSTSADGANLFHSFIQFGLTPHQVANFLSTPGLENIFSRINGGNPSTINGLIQVLGGNSNLYLINPAGILFGPNAQLNVPAAFHATTATGIGFGQNQWLDAFGDNNWQILTGTPNEFRFDGASPGVILNWGNLTVDDGEALNLTGGTVINLGTLNAPGGTITLGAVPGHHTLRISQEGHLLSLEIPVGDRQSVPFNPLSVPELLTGGEIPHHVSQIEVNAQGQLVLTHSEITIPDHPGVAIASETLDVSHTQPDLNSGTINIIGTQVGVIDATLDASTPGNGGQIYIGGSYQGKGPLPNAQQTLISPDSHIRANSLDNGNGGEIIIWSDGNTQFYGTVEA
ncbi:MAG TPA: filamentous hemagglutinin, partial [Cyanobacteria bacterium UBA11691]|nr:filamentous hemagglutinin [Cyanobacteria bacterium UBA11691]